MSLQTVHPVILLLKKMRQRPVDPEGRIPVLRREICDLNTDTYENAGSLLMGRRDLVDGNYMYNKALQSKQKVVYWKIDWTFERMFKDHDDSIAKLYKEIDGLRSEHRRNTARVKDLEIEISRDNIQAVTTLVRSPVLHRSDSIQKKPTGHLDLLAELRNEIYKLSECLELYCSNGPCTCYPLEDYQCQCVCSGFQPTMTKRDLSNKMVVVLQLIAAGWQHSFVDATSAKRDTLDAANHQPSLTRASKQIRAETLPMYYGNLHVTMKWRSDCNAASDVFKWLRRIGKQNAALIQNIEVGIGEPWSIQSDLEQPEVQEEMERCLEVLGELGIVTERCNFIPN